MNLLVLLVLSCVLGASFAAAELQLELVSLVFRHGDRTPVFPYPGDPYNASYWPQGFGQLTTRGMQEQYYLGELLRGWYAKTGFLNENYSSYQYVVRSTDVDRTLMSAESQMSALFYPSPAQQFNQTILWQPIPVHTVPTVNDFLLRAFGDGTCPMVKQLQEKTRQTPEYKEILQQNEHLLKAISGYTKTNVTLQNVYMIYDTLFVEHTNNLTMPSWFNTSLLARLKVLGDYTMGIMFDTEEKRKLTGGLWAKTVIDNMMAKANGTLPQRKVFSYSAHDTTVAAMLNVFNLYNGLQPPYAAAFIIELYKDTATSSYLVQFLYRNATDSSDRVNLQFSNCTQLCPLDTVARIMEPLLMTENEVKQMCGVLAASPSGVFFYVLLGMSIVVLLILTGIIIVLVALLIRSKHHCHSYHKITQDDLHETIAN